MDTKWTPEIVADFEEWLKTHTLDDYAHVEWDKKEGKDKQASGEEETLLG